MKKIIALAALMAIAPAFAAHNEFTFQVNSSGSDIYVCGFSVNNHRAVKSTSGVSGSYAVWSEEIVDPWDGTVLDTIEHNSLEEKPMDQYFVADASFYGRHQFPVLEKDYGMEIQRRVKDLTIYLSDEYFGASYEVMVCYDAPLFMDLDKVNFQVNNQIQFPNLTEIGQKYLTTAGVSTYVNVRTYQAADNKIQWGSLPNNGMHYFEVPANNGNIVGQDFLVSFAPFAKGNDFNKSTIISAYRFTETNDTVKRPHVAHGATFKLLTDVVPVAK